MAVTASIPMTQPTALPAWAREMWRYRVLYLFVLPFAALVVVFGLWPIAQSLVLSFASSATAFRLNPDYVGLENFETIFSDRRFIASLNVTLFYTAISVVLNVAFALGYAVLLSSRYLKRGNTFFRLAVFLPVITPDVAGFIVWKWMYNQNFGAVNAALGSLGLPLFGGIADSDTVLSALVVAELWKHVGFYTIIFLTNMQLLDPALDEAAELEGATAWQRFWYVTLPQLRPAITINVVFALIQFLKTFTVVVVMTKGGPNFSTNFISYYAFQKFEQASYGEAMAMASTLFGLVLVLTYALYWALERTDWR